MSRFTSYYLYQKYEKVGDGEWTPTYPNEYSISGDTENTMPLVIKSENDAQCGYRDPIYRWADTEDTICVYEDGYATQYLTFRSSSDNNTISFKHLNSNDQYETGVNTIQYTLDSGATWSDLTPQSSVTINDGDVIMFKASGLTVYSGWNSIGTFKTTGNYEVYGNILSLGYSDKFIGKTDIPYGYKFQDLFKNSTGLTSAENLILPSTTLTEWCYRSMFANCSNLITAPAVLPATTLAVQCYEEMFRSCTNLVNPPILPATTLANSCYMYMFWRCTSLTTAPELPATTLVAHCYDEMFYFCENLNYVKCLATDKSATDCTSYWLYRTASTGTFVKDANTTWPINDSVMAEIPNNGIPSGWTVQNA